MPTEERIRFWWDRLKKGEYGSFGWSQLSDEEKRRLAIEAAQDETKGKASRLGKARPPKDWWRSSSYENVSKKRGGKRKKEKKRKKKRLFAFGKQKGRIALPKIEPRLPRKRKQSKVLSRKTRIRLI